MKNMSQPTQQQLQQAIQRVMQQAQGQKQGKQKKWTEMLKERLKFLKKLEEETKKDRLGYALLIREMLRTVNITLQGWQKWYDDLGALEAINDKEYAKIYEIVATATKMLVNLDLEITKIKEEEVEKRQKKRKKKHRVTKKETLYIG